MVAKPRQQYLVLPVINSSGFNQFITSFVKNILEVLFEGFVILPGDWRGEVGRNLRGGETAAGFRWWGRGSVIFYQTNRGENLALEKIWKFWRKKC